MTGNDNPGAPASATGVRSTERTSKSLYYIDSTSAREPEAFFAVDFVVGRWMKTGRLKSVRLGGAGLIAVEALEALIAGAVNDRP